MTGNDALIHLGVPAATKARWVRESRAAGMRLTDWIVSRVEAQPMEKVTPVCIPQGMVLQNSVQTRIRCMASADLRAWQAHMGYTYDTAAT